MLHECVRRAMNDDFVYIEGHLGPDEHERLLQLIRRVEQVGVFREQRNAGGDFGPAWIVVIGWGKADDGPVSISRIGTRLSFGGQDVGAVAHRIEQWLEMNGDRENEDGQNAA